MRNLRHRQLRYKHMIPVADGKEAAWMDRALKAAFRIAKVTDETVQADKELD